MIEFAVDKLEPLSPWRLFPQGLMETQVEKLKPVVLVGTDVQLIPMTADHAWDLSAIGLDPSLWLLQPRPIQSFDDMQEYVNEALSQQERGQSLPFVVTCRKTSKVIGTTRYMDIALQHRRLEIGATWLSPERQRTAANSQIKMMMLEHAFERLLINRVVFKTEVPNQQSREALIRIGAVEDGLFRQHLVSDSGRARDIVFFSILKENWTEVRCKLVQRIRAHHADSACLRSNAI